MSVCVPMVVIQDEYGGYDGRRHHKHDAVEVRAQQRHGIGRGWHRLCHHVEEHRQRQQYCHTCYHFRFIFIKTTIN